MSEKNNNILKFQIIDTGIGIKKERIAELNKPFLSFDSEKKIDNNKIGLGLSISQKIIGLLGPIEKFFISSDFGIGTKFTFLINVNNFECEFIHKENCFKIFTSSSELNLKFPFKFEREKKCIVNQEIVS